MYIYLRIGCAYFNYFLLSGGRDHNNLQLALEAYKKAKIYVAVKSNPHLDYDCSMFKRNEKNKGKSKRKSKGKSKGKSTETSLPDLIQSLANIDGKALHSS